jgi:predicted enzyme related to lactoylglutathione lyase
MLGVLWLNIKAVNITFYVSDFLQAVSFYENTVGLQKKSQWSNYVVFDLCGVMLALEPGGERGAGKSVPDIYLQVDNVDEVFRELKGKGATLLTEPKDQSWGARTAKFADPDGNAFILVQLKK